MVSANSATDSNTRSQETKPRDTGNNKMVPPVSTLVSWESLHQKYLLRLGPQSLIDVLAANMRTFSFYWDTIQISHHFDTWVPMYQLCQLPNEVPTRFLISIKRAPPASVSPPDIYTLYTVLKSYLHCKGALLSVVGALGPIHLHAVHPHHRSAPSYVSLLGKRHDNDAVLSEIVNLTCFLCCEATHHIHNWEDLTNCPTASIFWRNSYVAGSWPVARWLIWRVDTYFDRHQP